MERKKLKFEKIFCALDEKSSKDTALTAGTPEMAISNQALEENSSIVLKGINYLKKILSIC